MEDWGAGMDDGVPSAIDYASAAAAKVRDALAATPNMAIPLSIEPLAGQTIVNQTNNFNQPVTTPYQYACAVRRNATYGLAGARG